MENNNPSSRLILLSILLAVLVAVIAFINGLLLPDDKANFMIENARQYLGRISFSFWGIFFNNLLTAMIMILGGIIFSLPSLFFYYTNFLLLGVVIKSGFIKVGLLPVFLSLFPHGLFEIPAIMISFSIALNFTFHLLERITLKIKGGTVELIKKSMAVFFLAVVPLLIIAAIIEVFVTPYLVRSLKIG